MKSIVILIMLLSVHFLVSAQTEIQKEDIIIHDNDFDEVGKTTTIIKVDSTLLPAGNYVMNFERRIHAFALYFTIIDSGMLDGIMIAKNDLGQTLVRCYIKKGVIQRYEKIDPKTNNLIEESFANKDTVISKHYNKYMQLRSEYRYVKKEEIYNWNCSYSSETDSLKSCILYDKIQGKYEYYNDNRILVESTRTKGLPPGIARQTEYFDDKGKRTSKEIEYSNGKTKKINKNGSYSITTELGGGQNVEEYNKYGKLLNSYKAYYPTISN